MVINMASFISSVLEALVLVTALSIDAFVASFAYGTNKVRIPFSSLAVMDLLSASILFLFLFLGRLISPLLSPGLIRIFCFAILFGLGIIKLFDSYLKMLIRKNGKNEPKLQFTFLQFRFILTVYADPDKANADRSNTLSPKEAVSLGAALSLDSAAAGFGAGFLALGLGWILLLSIIIGAFAIAAGSALGNKLAEKLSLNLSWLSGLLLIILAFMKFL